MSEDIHQENILTVPPDLPPGGGGGPGSQLDRSEVRGYLDALAADDDSGEDSGDGSGEYGEGEDDGEGADSALGTRGEALRAMAQGSGPREGSDTQNARACSDAEVGMGGRTADDAGIDLRVQMLRVRAGRAPFEATRSGDGGRVGRLGRDGGGRGLVLAPGVHL